jgi:hypothetical protein
MATRIVASGGGVEHRIALAGIPLTRKGAIGFQVDNAMAATPPPGRWGWTGRRCSAG